MHNNFCCLCNEEGITKAHVKDKSVCLSEGITDHAFRNIIDLCYYCHYEFFDDRKMGVKIKPDGRAQFIYLDKCGIIQTVESRCIINVLPEYLKWKNSKCVTQLWKYIYL